MASCRFRAICYVTVNRIILGNLASFARTTNLREIPEVFLLVVGSWTLWLMLSPPILSDPVGNLVPPRTCVLRLVLTTPLLTATILPL